MLYINHICAMYFNMWIRKCAIVILDSVVLIVPARNLIPPLTLLWPRLSLIKVEICLIWYVSVLCKKLGTNIVKTFITLPLNYIKNMNWTRSLLRNETASALRWKPFPRLDSCTLLIVFARIYLIWTRTMTLVPISLNFLNNWIIIIH